ncbi:MAG: hypothetical protein RLZZ196_1538 [Bacteroidota bacterium]|jgi:hypothetical protein
MSVQQGLKSLAETSPNFSNTGVETAITSANTGFVTKTKTLNYLVDINSTLTDSQKTTIQASLNIQPYLNAGRYLQDLSNHTYKILDGSLGEVDEGDPAPTFLDLLSSVDAIQGLYLSLYGAEASTVGKGVDDYFGTLRETMNDKLTEIKNAVQTITNASLATDTAFQNATQALIDFVNALGDSTTLDTSTLNSLLSAYESAANNFNTTLSGAAYSSQKTVLVNNRATIVSQIATEVANLGSIKTYSESLANLSSYQGLASNSKIRDLIGKSAQTTEWKDYYENYETRFAQLNAKYENTAGDSENETIINNELTQRGLPDVKDYTDLRAVASKASRDDRLSTVKFNGRTIAEIIKDSCVQLNIDIKGLNVYGQSQALLNNMNEYDKESIRTELNLHQESNTLS